MFNPTAVLNDNVISVYIQIYSWIHRARFGLAAVRCTSSTLYSLVSGVGGVMVLINPPSLGTRSEGQCRPEFCPERPVPVLVEAHTDLPVRCDLGAEHGNVVLLRCPQLADPSAPPFTDTGGTCSSRRTSRGQQRQDGWPAPVWCGSTSPSCATGHL